MAWPWPERCRGIASAATGETAGKLERLPRNGGEEVFHRDSSPRVAWPVAGAFGHSATPPIVAAVVRDGSSRPHAIGARRCAREAGLFPCRCAVEADRSIWLHRRLFRKADFR